MNRSTELLESGVMVQVGIVVRDCEATAAHYADLLGVAKPAVCILANEPISNTHYRGIPSTAYAKGAFLDLGPQVQLEIIEPVGAPSTWQEFLDTNGPGVHHIAFKTASLKDTTVMLEKKGMPLVQRGEWTGGRYGYFESVPQLGVILEILQRDE